MLRRNSVPKMGEQGAEIGGEYEVLSSQESPQKQDMSTIKSEDAIMSDQAPTEVQSQAQPLDDIADLQLITKDDFETPQDRNSIKTLGADSKRLRKTVVKQKTETDNLKVKVVVDNQLRDADRHRQNLELELSQAQAQLAITEQALKASNDRWTHQNKNVKKLHAKLKASNGIISSVKAINSDLQDNLVASRDEFLRCQDDLFSLQPMARVPDSSIFKELEIVSEEVVHWIEAEVAAFEKAHPEAEPEHIFSAGKNADAAIFLQYYPAAGEHLARYLVHRFFQVNLFENTFYLLGLTEEIAQLLQKAEHSMAKFDPPRGCASIAAWRSETLQALAATEDCQQSRKGRLREMNEQLFKELGWIFPKLFARRNSMTRFYQQVLQPAAKVAMTIRTSASTYTYSMAGNPFHTWVPLGVRHMTTHRMLDVKNGSYLKPNAAVVADKDGIIGKFIIPLEPGLYRIKEGKDKTTLLPVMYLVELNHPVAKHSQGSA